jgi:hypothetical protein
LHTQKSRLRIFSYYSSHQILCCYLVYSCHLQLVSHAIMSCRSTCNAFVRTFVLGAVKRRRTLCSGASCDHATSRLTRILQQVKDGHLHPSEAEGMIRNISIAAYDDDDDSGGGESSVAHQATTSQEDDILTSFANLDHTRSSRTGFPEVVFGAGKTPDQVSRILDDMARNFNERSLSEQGTIPNSQRAILATR